MRTVFAQLSSYLTGWREYFRLAQTPGIFRELDEWLRHRPRMVQLRKLLNTDSPTNYYGRMGLPRLAG
jgi:hypothetical protein